MGGISFKSTLMGLMTERLVAWVFKTTTTAAKCFFFYGTILEQAFKSQPHEKSKNLLISMKIVYIIPILLFGNIAIAQQELNAEQRLEMILESEGYRDGLANFKAGIETVLADPRLTDQPTRQSGQIKI